ncbi:MAG: AbrB/MazE/SpoVT family DNA-binding domain-containing protein [Ruminococcus sp.]|nr:AbrB/MazE/SpoVT family DNA-binding domain-containing protein [Ruminococcus sp.]
MKATGIVRRIDDLGRVVIPKEIRRTMRIREGDPLEIYTGPEGEVVFRKFSPVGELDQGTVQAAEVISKLAGQAALVFDRDHVVAVSGARKTEYAERRLSAALEELIEQRRSYVFDRPDTPRLFPIEGLDKPALAAVPIISAGDAIGAVALISTAGEPKADEKNLMLAKAAAMFLGKQIEN